MTGEHMTREDATGTGESAWERRRRLAEVFGDTLPETTSDERDDQGATRSGEDGQDRWLREQVPPHHGS